MAASDDRWSVEIRDYLLGRLSSSRAVHELTASERTRLPTIPIRDWWLFEGKRYASLDGPLCQNWSRLRRSILAMVQTHNPTWRVTEHADGWIDWSRTLAHCHGRYPREFIVQSSRAGLDDAERAALAGWIGWISQQWQTYSHRPAHLELNPLHGLAPAIPALQAAPLGRWAHIARRSRWPLLRDVVAETLRVVLEPQDVERIPLPTERARLFELLCLVRILRELAPPPRTLRWISPELDDNTIVVADITAHYQPTLARERALLAYRDCDLDALRVFDVRVPSRADLTFELAAPRNRRFDGILVEAKSGDQDYGSALEQLRVYRQSIPRRPGQRLLIWGITEHASLRPDQLDWLRKRCRDSEGDIWAFSGIEDMRSVLHAVFEEADLGGKQCIDGCSGAPGMQAMERSRVVTGPGGQEHAPRPHSPRRAP